MICRKCGKKMKNVLHFEKDRDYQYNECSKCCERTKKKRIHYDEFSKLDIIKRGGA